MEFSIMFWPSLISALLFMPFGAFLYSNKGLGKEWLLAINKTEDDIKNESNNMGLLMGGTLVLAIVSVLLIDVLVVSLNITTVLDLFLLLVIVYLLVFSIRLKNSLFDGNLKLFKVNLLGTLGEFVIVFIVFSIFVVM